METDEQLALITEGKLPFPITISPCDISPLTNDPSPTAGAIMMQVAHCENALSMHEVRITRLEEQLYGR